MKIKLDSSQHLSFNLACPVHLKLTDSTGKIPQAARAAQRQVESRHKICVVSLWATMSAIFIAPFLSRNWQDLVHGPASPQSDLACRRNPQASDARPCQRPITIPMFRNLLWFSYVFLFLFCPLLPCISLWFPVFYLTVIVVPLDLSWFPFHFPWVFLTRSPITWSSLSHLTFYMRHPYQVKHEFFTDWQIAVFSLLSTNRSFLSTLMTFEPN